MLKTTLRVAFSNRRDLIPCSEEGQRRMWMVIRQPGITTGGKTYDLVHAGTSNAERTKLGGTWFHHTALGLASTTTNGVDTGKRTHTYAYGPTGLPPRHHHRGRPPALPLRRHLSGSDRPVQDGPTVTTTPPSAASPSPTHRGRKPTLTSTPAVTPSTTAIRPACSGGRTSEKAWEASQAAFSVW